MLNFDLIIANTQLSVLCLFPVAVFGLFLNLYRKAILGRSNRRKAQSGNAYASPIETIVYEPHAAQNSLRDLVEIDGAGTWPPTTVYGDAWPETLRPFHDIYQAMAPALSTAELSADDLKNFQRCLDFRVQMRTLYNDQVNMDEVKALLDAAENDENFLSRAAWNGFFACIALSRHSFRLSRPYLAISQGGNVASNYLCNFDDKDQIVYPINPTMDELIQSAEYHFGHVFPHIEREALPIYHMVTKAIQQYYNGDRFGTLQSLKGINKELRIPLKTDYETMHESKISRKVWMHYAQGFQGWAAGDIDPTTGEYTEYDGLSGNQLLLPQIMDAFLGLDRYLNEENTQRYIPNLQRKFRETIAEHSFRNEAKKNGDNDIENEMNNIVKQMRVFRTARRVRVKPYLSVPAPERMIMTAGKSVLEKDDVHDYESAIAPLDKMLKDRLMATK
ncbi:a46f086a-1e1e-4904-a37a-fd01776fa871 [Sclerotinia trifoliorum]|uniref:Indoleamine 2,3-dioxygenase n=1 Tax=Sclerotinia trifoliorum TaxID=28548 RepID=A0A8H2ZSC5_9HELO|nr:a46f086a-1e1e-4904-a37a-fd01776fa871 [Sclerotinia trifoliorum]